MSNNPQCPAMLEVDEVSLPAYLDRYAAEVEAWRIAALRRRALRPPSSLPRRRRPT